jgi:cytochrome c553
MTNNNPSPNFVLSKVMLFLFLFTFYHGGKMKLFNWHKVALLSAGLAFTANIWAVQSLNDVNTPSLELDDSVTTSVQKTGIDLEYKKMAQDNLAQLAAIEKALRSILSQNYYNFPEQKAQVTELLQQLNEAKKAENEAQAAADKGDWDSAKVAVKQWQQAQIQASESVSKIQSGLKQVGAKQILALKVPIEPLTNPFAPVSDGEKLYNEKACVACHGIEGKIPVTNTYPQLAGQVAEYALAQMKDIKHNMRTNGESILMRGHVQAVSDDELKSIAQWLASVSIELNSDASMDTKGAQLYQSKGCIACHGADAKTPLANYPKLVGLNEAYTIVQMTDIKRGGRDNGQSGMMKAIMQNVSDEEIQSIAQWLASLVKPVEPPPSVEMVAPVEAMPPITSVEEIEPASQNDPSAETKVETLTSPMTPVEMVEPDSESAMTDSEEMPSAVEATPTPIVVEPPKETESVELPESIVEPTPPIKSVEEIESPASELPKTPVIETLDGATLYNNKTCIACHGSKGQMPITADYPQLAGQNPAYLFAQMQDIKSGARDNGQSVLMKGIMQTVNEQQMTRIADWLASIPAMIKNESAAEMRGAQLYQTKGCMACHGADAKTPLSNYPKLAGLNAAYSIVQMTDIKSGVRNNGQSAVMKAIMETVSEEEIQSIAQWLASLPQAAVQAEDAQSEDTQESVVEATMPEFPEEIQTIDSVEGTMPSTQETEKIEGSLESEKATDVLEMKPTTSQEVQANKNSQETASGKTKSSVTPLEQIETPENISLETPNVVDPTPSINEEVEPVSETGTTTLTENTESEKKKGSITPIEVVTPSSENQTRDSLESSLIDESLLEGAQLYKEKGCLACHGAEGKQPIMLNYPKLAGQHSDYTVVQLKDIKSGARDNGQSMVMKGIMQGVNEKEMGLIAQWLGSLPQEMATETIDSPLIAEGAKYYQEKTCATCHGQVGHNPVMSNYPKLAGQHPDYLIAQMTDIKRGVRDNGLTIVMKGVMQAVSDEEIAAIAQWLFSAKESKKKTFF